MAILLGNLVPSSQFSAWRIEIVLIARRFVVDLNLKAEALILASLVSSLAVIITGWEGRELVRPDGG